MKGKIRYQSKVDLKVLRQIYKLSKEEVAQEIGYATRSLERMEKENAVVGEETAKQLCKLYNLNFDNHFSKIEHK